jgi:glutamyl-Q tRNA(Asp) synthetase
LNSYRGRFAPSPTGELHFGSLVAAVASYLDARRAGGAWLVRIEDVDKQREVPGSAEHIIATLHTFGFEWTESIVRQSERVALYTTALKQLLSSHLAYPCSCSRAEIAAAAEATPAIEGDELRYPGWCRNGVRDPTRPQAIRFRTPSGPLSFVDDLQGPVRIDVASQVGDFVIRRRDGFFAYQLAVVVDDAEQGITHVVRGADLLNSTPRQIFLQQALGVPILRYAHVPLATDANGVKLSKSAGTAAIDLERPGAQLWRVLEFLRQSPPPELRDSQVPAIWRWAFEHWNPASLVGIHTKEVSPG